MIGQEMGLKERMRIQLASLIGLVAFILGVVFIFTGCRLYREAALLMGIWKEPPLIDALLAGYGFFLIAALIGGAVRWWLIYKWVALEGERSGG